MLAGRVDVSSRLPSCLWQRCLSETSCRDSQEVHHPVSRREAQARAKGLRPAALAPYYIYNDAQGKGFVVVAGDDDMGDVLAYSTEGALDTLQANPGVKLLLEAYRQTYDVLKEGRVMVQRKARSGLFSKTVSPLLKSKWGQSHPFNAQTGYPYSGCVATAVAQMMYYYQWPAQGRGKNEYRVTYYNTMKSADFSQSHYDWANMLPDYNYPVSATKEQEDAVALLMNDVGVASFMQYTPASSGTQGIFAYQALQKNFDYTAALSPRLSKVRLVLRRSCGRNYLMVVLFIWKVVLQVMLQVMLG